MGYRLHVAERHEIKYANVEAFNHKCVEFHYLLIALEVDFTGDIFSEDFEVSKLDWEDAIELLRDFNQLMEDRQDKINKCLESLECSLDEAIELFEAYYEASDPSNDYMFFSFF